MTVNEKYRNTVRKAQSNILAGKHAPEPTTQSKNDATILQRGEEIQKPIPAETDRNLKYDIKELRKHPGKLTEANQKRQQEIDETKQPDHDWRE